jgi:5-methylcytosine-specific restriction endonuclease McrA
MAFRAYKIKRDGADEVFSLYIRLRDKRCLRCGKIGEEDKNGNRVIGLDCSLYFGRWMEGGRFNPDNCVTLCRGCHQHWEKDRDDYRAFMIKRLGENEFKILEWVCRSYTKKDRKFALLKARELLKTVA